MSGSFALHLMRHGEPEGAGRLLGSTDSPITLAGIAACRARASQLAFDHVVASDLRRAADSARAISEGVSLDPRWRELDFGSWDGLATDQIPAEEIGRFWQDPEANSPPGGERWSGLVRRVGEAIAALAPAPTLVVTHGGAMRAALHILCGFDQRELWAFDLPYGVSVSLRIWLGPQPAAQIVAIQP